MQSELKSVKTAMATTEVVDGFEVLHTANVADTFRLYATITKRLVVMLLSSCQLYKVLAMVLPFLKCYLHLTILPADCNV